MKPKVSFIVAVKNRAAELREMLQTLIKQDIEGWEAIIVNDDSSESIHKVVDSFNDKRFYYFDLPREQHGISNARNYAIKFAKSNYMLIADGDDLNEPSRARTTYDIMSHNKCDIFYGNMTVFSGQRKRSYLFQPFNANLLKMTNFIPNPSAAFCRDKFLEIGGYDPGFEISEDYDLWLRFLKSSAKFCYTKEVLVNYRRGRKSIIRGKKALLHDSIQKARTKNHIKPFNIEEIREYAQPEIARILLLKRNRLILQDDRFNEIYKVKK